MDASIRKTSIIFIIGPTACGKSTCSSRLGALLETREPPIRSTVLDADAFHPASNVAKMSRGEPLTDNDRWPWLAAVREAALQEARRLEEAGEENGTESGRISDNAVVFACSALKRVYREVLAGYRDQTGHPITPALSPYPITFIYLKITPDLVRKRIMARVGHFMNPKLVDSQFEALEEPDLEEGEVEGVKRYSVVHVAVNESKDEKAVAKEALESWLSSS